MIRQKIVLPEYGGWTIYCFYAVTRYDVHEIMSRLHSIGCDSSSAKKAYRNLSESKLNTGLCYSNARQRRTVFVTALTTCAAEFINSWHHELGHLESHICEAYGMNPKGEEIAYLSGDLAMEMFPKIKHLICECCRKKEYGR